MVGQLSALRSIFRDPTAACSTPGLGGCARLASLRRLIGSRVSTVPGELVGRGEAWSQLTSSGSQACFCWEEPLLLRTVCSADGQPGASVYYAPCPCCHGSVWLNSHEAWSCPPVVSSTPATANTARVSAPDRLCQTNWGGRCHC